MLGVSHALFDTGGHVFMGSIVFAGEYGFWWVGSWFVKADMASSKLRL